MNQKEYEIESLQKHVADLASTNARLQRRGNMPGASSSAAVTALQRLMKEWFDEFRQQVSLANLQANCSHGPWVAAESHYQALLASMVTLLQVCNEDCQQLSPAPLYLNILQRSIYAGQEHLKQSAPPPKKQASSGSNLSTSLTPPMAPGLESSMGGGSGAATAHGPIPVGSASAASHPVVAASVKAPPMMHTLGDKPIPRRAPDANSVWDFIFGDGGYTASECNNAESTHVLPV
jgi:hypothetical protein